MVREIPCWCRSMVAYISCIQDMDATVEDQSIHPTEPAMSRFFKSLFGQVLLALVIGVVVGVVWPEFAVKLKPLGDGFIRLIKMIIPILVFCVVVHGIAGTGDLKRVGRVGVKALVYFEVVTTIALGLGLLLGFVFHPGTGMNVDPSKLDPSALSSYTSNAEKLAHGGVVDFLMRLIPNTVGGAFATGDVLQVLLFAILFGCALAQLGALVALFYVAVAIFVFVILGLILRLAGFNIFKLLGYLREELMVVLATTSSDAVLPQVMSKLKRMGIKDSTVGLVIPTGYSFNLDAFSIYITLAAVFIAQATNTNITMAHLLTILVVALITSKGAHGVPGSAIVVLAATLQAIPDIPAIGLVLVLSVYWFMGIARALGNLTGNCVATVVVASWEGDIDKERARAVLDGRHVPETEDDADAEISRVPAGA